MIPCRTTDVPRETIESLFAQTYKHLEFIIVVDAEQRGQSWARNQGIQRSSYSLDEIEASRLILFSDYDCRWEPDAVECLYDTLCTAQTKPRDTDDWVIGYSFPSYVQLLDGVPVKTFGLEPWSWPRLTFGNYITMMSLVDIDVLKGILHFDERLRRLEDWDLWLRCGQHGIAGVGTGRILFTTDVKPGVSYGDLSHAEAEIQVRKLRGL